MDFVIYGYGMDNVILYRLFLQIQTAQGFFKVWIITTNKYIYRKYRESKAFKTSANDVCKRDLFLKDAK